MGDVIRMSFQVMPIARDFATVKEQFNGKERSIMIIFPQQVKRAVSKACPLYNARNRK